jgi:hypothetical protein
MLRVFAPRVNTPKPHACEGRRRAYVRPRPLDLVEPVAPVPGVFIEID